MSNGYNVRFAYHWYILVFVSLIIWIGWLSYICWLVFILGLFVYRHKSSPCPKDLQSILYPYGVDGVIVLVAHLFWSEEKDSCSIQYCFCFLQSSWLLDLYNLDNPKVSNYGLWAWSSPAHPTCQTTGKPGNLGVGVGLPQNPRPESPVWPSSQWQGANGHVPTAFAMFTTTASPTTITAGPVDLEYEEPLGPDLAWDTGHRVSRTPLV